MRVRRLSVLAGALLSALAFGASIVEAQNTARPATQAAADDDTAIRGIVQRALERISAEDMIGFTDLMLPGAVIGAVAERDGRVSARLRTRDAERARSSAQDIVERGFAVEVKQSGPLAMAWVPYDLYIDGAWSHCGVDVFTLFRTSDGWRIASLTYSVEQPPACVRHPDGPPAAR